MTGTATPQPVLDFLLSLKGQGEVILTGPDGKPFATVRVPDPELAQLPPGVKSPFGERELEDRRKDRTLTGRTTADVLRDLEARG